MDAENFFARWSRHKPEPMAEIPDADAKPVPAGQPEPKPALPPPTIEDVAALTPQSDYTRFIAKGVDEDIKRSALKKLFTDPHFNIMDGLDTYIEDYNKFEPIPPEMLALLNHAKGLLDPLSQFEQPLMRLMDNVLPPEPAPADAQPDADDNAADIAAASAEPETLEAAEADTDAPASDDGGMPPQTMTRPEDDHNQIQGM